VVVVVTRPDRLARSTGDLLAIPAAITDREAGFQSPGPTRGPAPPRQHGRRMLTEHQRRAARPQHDIEVDAAISDFEMAWAYLSRFPNHGLGVVTATAGSLASPEETFDV
jgi:hypothetical protein